MEARNRSLLLQKNVGQELTIVNGVQQLLRPFNPEYDILESTAYTVGRMISSYSALVRILSEVKKRIPHYNPTSMLDFGTGPGTAIWASRYLWPITHASAVDLSKSMLSIAANIASSVFKMDSFEIKRHLTLTNQTYPLVVSSFALTELSSDSYRGQIIDALWKSCSDTLVLVDRGTPLGFEAIVKARDQIVKKSSEKNEDCHIVAPVI
jgi:ribosomal protein RSM22 (predicted rRNA methylase)